MEKGMAPGADFFDDGSSGSEWEDSDGEATQTFCGAENLELGSLAHELDLEELKPRGRPRERNTISVIPQSNQTSQASKLVFEDQQVFNVSGSNDTKQAREMSLKRLGKDNLRLVTTRSNGGTPRQSRGNSPVPELPKPPPSLRTDDAPTGILRTNSFNLHQRRNTTDSVLADSIIDAHVMTMRALESLSPSASISQLPGRTYLHTPSATEFPALSSFSSDRHIKLPSISTIDCERPAHLPHHFIKTPYPFTAKKEFPKPKTRPRQRADGGSHSLDANLSERLDSGYGDKEFHHAYDDEQRKYALGLVNSDGEYDLRSRLERNGDAQEITRSFPGSQRAGTHSVVWLSLEKRTRRRRFGGEPAGKLVRVDVPSNLTAKIPGQRGQKSEFGETVDFDDQYFAQRLRAGYHELAGSWFARAFSARTLNCIRLGQFCAWSGLPSPKAARSISGLLAMGEGIELSSDLQSPFTENGLMKLYNKPAIGKARYTWVHWSRKITSWDKGNRCLPLEHVPSTLLHNRRTRSLDDTLQKADEHSSFTPYSSDARQDAITTIQFVQSLSKRRVLFALVLMLLLSVAAPLLWVFVGAAASETTVVTSREWSNRLAGGMAIGILFLLLEGVGFGAWVWIS